MRLAIIGKFDVEELEHLLNPLHHSRLIIHVIYDQILSDHAVIVLADTNHRVDSMLTHIGSGNECKIIRNEYNSYIIRRDGPFTDDRPWKLSPPFIHRPPRYIGDLIRPYSFPCILYKDSFSQFPHEVILG
jgi:hypothetical protein